MGVAPRDRKPVSAPRAATGIALAGVEPRWLLVGWPVGADAIGEWARLHHACVAFGTSSSATKSIGVQDNRPRPA